MYTSRANMTIAFKGEDNADLLAWLKVGRKLGSRDDQRWETLLIKKSEIGEYL